MAITNQSKPSSSLANSSKASASELWSTITTTWASETRTWSVLSFITNLYTDFGGLWSALHYPWQDIAPWQTGSNITNQAKT